MHMCHPGLTVVVGRQMCHPGPTIVVGGHMCQPGLTIVVERQVRVPPWSYYCTGRTHVPPWSYYCSGKTDVSAWSYYCSGKTDVSPWSYSCKRCVSLRYGPLARIPLPYSHVVDANTEENATFIMLQRARLYFLPSKNMKYSLEEKPELLEDHNSEANN